MIYAQASEIVNYFYIFLAIIFVLGLNSGKKA